MKLRVHFKRHAVDDGRCGWVIQQRILFFWLPVGITTYFRKGLAEEMMQKLLKGENVYD